MSIPSRSFLPDDLHELLERTRKSNKEKGITGILLYKKTNFMQVLEGEESVLDALYSKISLDPRHHNVTQLAKERISKREFPDWSMAFRDLNNESQDILSEFSDLLNLESRNVDLNLYSQRVRSFLKIFIE
jgi:hypothetical protein